MNPLEKWHDKFAARRSKVLAKCLPLRGCHSWGRMSKKEINGGGNQFLAVSSVIRACLNLAVVMTSGADNTVASVYNYLRHQ